MKVRTWIAGLVCIGLTAASAQTVTRDLAASGAASWRPSAYTTGDGSIDESADGKLILEARYSGKGFEAWGADLGAPIPGRCQRVRARYETSGKGGAWVIKFVDADGKGTVDKRKLHIGLKSDRNEVEFDIPANWKQPLTLAGIGTHNWGHRNDTAPSQGQLKLLSLEIVADISTVEDKDELLSISLHSPAERNVFVGDEPVTFSLLCDSWLPEPVTGKLKTVATGPAGERVLDITQDLVLRGTLKAPIPIPLQQYGPFHLAVTADLQGGRTFNQTARGVRVPAPRKLTHEAKLESPYALTIHGGHVDVAYKTFGRLGIAWLRDYAYSFAWLKKARGADGRYGGWPWYPKMEQALDESGCILLPCLMGAISEYVRAGKMQPDLAWRHDLVHILWAFPQHVAWELDNEYDLNTGREMDADRKAYDAFHAEFAKVVRFMNPDALVVENGTAGVHPDWVETSIANGTFKDLDVINGHFYCGIAAPEVSTRNANTGQGGEPPSLMRDSLREFVAASDSDGKDRQTWITEFGWDTLAVHIVSEHVQAAYLQRGFCMGIEAGIDKLFWYWNLDTTGTPNNFFDGCGIFDPRCQAKPAAAAFAALASLLPNPEALGTFVVDENAMGYVFESDGQRVACVFKTDPDGPEPAKVHLTQGQVRDMYGNALPHGTYALDVAPLWITGLDADNAWVKQTASDILSRRFVRCTAGDAMEVRVRGHATLDIPEGWSEDAGQVRIPPTTPKGYYTVGVAFDSGKRDKIDVQVVPFAHVTAKALEGPRASATLTVSVRNNSLTARPYAIQPVLPDGWKVTPAERRLESLASEQQVEATFTVDWSRGAPAGGRVVVLSEGETIAEAPIIPNAWSLPRADDAWPDAARLPGSMLGSTVGEPRCDVDLAWSPKGLRFKVRVHDSKGDVPDPRGFWSGDVVELCVDTQGDTKDRASFQSTDHQFWFCPMLESGTVYAGRWKRADEIAETQYNIDNITGTCRRTGDGYAMDVLLPAAAMTGFKGEKGRTLGVNINVSVVGKRDRREVYWPLAKREGAMRRPAKWGRVILR